MNRKIKSAKETFYKDLIDDSNGNSSSLWKIFGELANFKKNKKGFPNEIVTDDEEIDDSQKICEAFIIHFATIGEKIEKNIKSHDPNPFSFPNSSTSFFFFPAMPEEIYLLTGDIKTKKAVRENDTSNNLLKLSNTVISPFLCIISHSCN